MRTTILDSLPEGKSHCGEQSGNKLLSVRSAFIFMQPGERLTDFKQPRRVQALTAFHMWGTESHSKHIQTGD